MKTIKGKTINLQKRITGIITSKNNIFSRNKILISDKVPFWRFGIKAIISEQHLKTSTPIFITENTDLKTGDVVTITPDGNCNVVWDKESKHNAFYLTDLCNSNCIMCPQTDGSSRHYFECYDILDCLKPEQLKYIGITGGEPTLEFDKLILFLQLVSIRSKTNPNIHILTNGREFFNEDNTEKLLSVKKCSFSFGIPLYSAVSEEHDYIVGVKGAFKETIQGIYNLARYHQKIEIRIVVMKQNYKYLSDIVEYIYRNMPFVSHIAFMGMEYHGNAETNYNLVSIDPIDYKEELFNAIRQCVRNDLSADIYNIPLCLIDERIHSFSRDSISNWKKIFVPECENCAKQEICSGVFKTSFVQSKNIKSFSCV